MSSITQARLKRFKSIKRGYYAAWLMFALFILSLGAELIANHRALIVKYNNQYFFPTYGKMISGQTFGLDYPYETNYRELAQQFKTEQSDNWVLMPPIPYGVFEADLKPDVFVPSAPNIADRHYLGTDNTGRDVLARLIYGFRLAFLFSLMLMVLQFMIGIFFGTLLGYRGGLTDLIGQRLLEIWNAVPVLYIIMILAAIITPGFWTLLVIMALFSWMGMTELIRTSVYKEKARDYVLAARAIGASHWRIMFSHILPNTMAVIVTALPFSLAGGITALTSLDYLGFGLPAPAPSWGELLQQGVERLDKPWIVLSTVCVLSVVLVLVTFIGEAVREAFDPKRFSAYDA
ncbi:MAG: peptide ABC transporter permease [Gammaproteobacteria bacterium]|nr:MAG: peptide ABC transporter permease [Gammaproteobacteria bacterium]